MTSHCEPWCSTTLRLCWLNDHHLSVLPGKWLNRALWLAINHNLCLFSPLRFRFFWTLCVPKATGHDQKEKTPHKMWPNLKIQTALQKQGILGDHHCKHTTVSRSGSLEMSVVPITARQNTVWDIYKVVIIESTQHFVEWKAPKLRFILLVFQCDRANVWTALWAASCLFNSYHSGKVIVWCYIFVYTLSHLLVVLVNITSVLMSELLS